MYKFKKYLLVTLILFSFSSHADFKQAARQDKPNTNQSPGALDYSQLSLWAAHPLKHDPSDSIPAFVKDEKRDSSVDVFFLHPTTYTKKFKGWNADINDKEVNNTTDMGTILFQASVFNGSCRVFAPRYRQAHLKAFFTRDKESAKKALDFAYEDLKNAFQYYLDHWNHGRPIIIASHSQGTRHAIRLLKEFFDSTALQKQLVCAYLVGYQVKKDAFTMIPLGKSPTETGCVLAWRTFKKGFIPSFVKKEVGNCMCINPLTWVTSNEWTPEQQYPGLLGRDFNQLIFKGEISACIVPDANIIWVDLPARLRRRYPIRNFHVADYNLFYPSIRKNVKERIEVYNKLNGR